MSVCCVWEKLCRVWGSEFVLFVREFGVSLENECVLCVGEIGAGLAERDGAVCGTVCCGFLGVRMCCVGQFGAGLGE